MKNIYEHYFEDFIITEVSTTDRLIAIEAELSVKLPEDYRDFLLLHGGGEGFLGEQYVMLWNGDQIIPYNAGYQTATNVPGFLLFGSNGGGEGLAFNLNDDGTDIVIVPFVGMSPKYAKIIASSFTEFLEKMSQPNAELF